MENLLPKRKPTRLKEFDYSSNGAYFITICTKERQKILSKIVGDGAHDVPKTELTQYGKIAEKYILSTDKIENVFVEQYVIMPNHIHMIVFVDNPNSKYENLKDGGTSRRRPLQTKLFLILFQHLKGFVIKKLATVFFNAPTTTI